MAEAFGLAILPCFFSLVLLLSTANSVASIVGEKHGVKLKFQWREQGLKTKCFGQRARTANGASILELKHHESCLGSIRSPDQKRKNGLIYDAIRVKSLQSRFKTAISGYKFQDSLETRIPIISGNKLDILNYIVMIELGNQNKTVIVDTGSDLVWVQCAPCDQCYEQQDPLYNPSNSPSFSPILCNSTCSSLQAVTGNSGTCISNRCNYNINYGDGSYSRGELARDHLVLGGSDSFEGFVFGCGHSNRGLFGRAGGLIGLGRNNLSLISQTSSKYGGVFSYCLASDDSSGSLILGGDPLNFMNNTPIQYTPMISFPQLSNFYFLNLTGFSVGGITVQAPKVLNGGTLIDSGTVITRLVPSLYRSVRDEFLKQVSGFPTAPGFSILETCFNFTGYEEIEIPTLNFLFEGGVEVSVDVSGIFYKVQSDASQVCLALASLADDDDVGIIGNYQQKNLRVVYDNKESRLGFAKEICSF